jgi:threonine dehydratase
MEAAYSASASASAATETQTTLTLEGAETALRRLAPHVVETPIVELDGDAFGLPGTRLVFKLELLQTTNAFKFRGAVNNIMSLVQTPGCRGAVTVSSGNHGIALAEAGRRFGKRVVVFVAPNANPWRRARIEALGAEVKTAQDISGAFAQAMALGDSEHLRLVHPYDGLQTLEGAAALGLEFASQAGELDAVVVPIGGGGLAAGVAFAMQNRQPELTVYGVEPEGAQTMTTSLAAGRPTPAPSLETIADSLAAPMVAPMSFEICRERLSEVLLVDDARIIAAMRLIWSVMRQGVEPSAAISTAAVLGPLRERVVGRRIGLILCGGNQEPDRQFEMLTGD